MFRQEFLNSLLLISDTDKVEFLGQTESLPMILDVMAMNLSVVQIVRELDSY